MKVGMDGIATGTQEQERDSGFRSPGSGEVVLVLSRCYAAAALGREGCLMVVLSFFLQICPGWSGGDGERRRRGGIEWHFSLFYWVLLSYPIQFCSNLSYPIISYL